MKRFLSLFLSLLFLASVFSGCDTQAETTTAEGGSETSSSPDTDSTVVNIVSDGKSGFSLSYSPRATDEIIASVKWLQKAVERYTGAVLPIVEADNKDDVSAMKDTVYVYKYSTYKDETLDELDYAMYNNGNNAVIIQCGSKYSASLAVEGFIKEYVTREGVSFDAGEGKLVKKETIDNSALMPVYVADNDVKLETTGDLSTPDWFKSAVMVELRILTATKEGTFAAAIPLLDHYAEMGVNCIWLTPIYEMGAGGNGYGNLGLHTLEPALTGTTDVEEGWAVVKNFIDEAHSRNIRILLDIITWGTMKGAALKTEHPEFFSGAEAWGNWAFDWGSSELKAWFIENAVNNILKCGADGYRCDCEPNYAGYKVFAEIRQQLLDKGKKIVILAEDGNNRQNAFDSEMDGVLYYKLKSRGEQYINPTNFYLDVLNIVDSVKTGTGIGSSGLQSGRKGGRFRFYTYCVTNHDYQHRVVNGNRLVIGYQAIFSPYIPYWYMGDEFGVTMENSAVLYDVPVDYSQKNNTWNKLFFEDVKQMLSIRLSYPEIFTYTPDDHRDSNICAVAVNGLSKLQAYARYAGNKGVMIIPNYEEDSDGYFIAAIPYSDMGLDGYTNYRLTDLLTDKVIAEGTKETLASFEGFVRYEYMGVFLIEGID